MDELEGVLRRTLEQDSSFKHVVIEGDCLVLLRCVPQMMRLVVTDPAYESLERHRAKGTTTRLKDSDASSNVWFPIFQNVNYWSLFGLLYHTLLDNSHCYVFCDRETEHVILSGRDPFHPPADAILVECEKTYYGGVGRTPVRGTLDYPARFRVWPTLAWLKTIAGEHLLVTDPDYDESIDSKITTGMGYHWRRCEESVLFLEKGARGLNNRSWRSVLCGSRAKKTDYPTQKPLAVLNKLIRNSTHPDDVVLDCFAGSGVTGQAAHLAKRRSVLIDIDVTDLLRRGLVPLDQTLVLRTEW